MCPFSYLNLFSSSQISFFIIFSDPPKQHSSSSHYHPSRNPNIPLCAQDTAGGEIFLSPQTRRNSKTLMRANRLLTLCVKRFCSFRLISITPYLYCFIQQQRPTLLTAVSKMQTSWRPHRASRSR